MSTPKRYVVRPATNGRSFVVVDTMDSLRVIESFSSQPVAVSFCDAMNQGRVCSLPEREGV